MKAGDLTVRSREQEANDIIKESKKVGLRYNGVRVKQVIIYTKDKKTIELPWKLSSGDLTYGQQWFDKIEGKLRSVHVLDYKLKEQGKITVDFERVVSDPVRKYKRLELMTSWVFPADNLSNIEIEYLSRDEKAELQKQEASE